VSTAHRRSVTSFRALGLVAALTTVLTPVAALTAAGQTSLPDGSQPTSSTRLTLVEQSAWVAPSGSFDLSVLVENGPTDAAIEVTVHDDVAGLGRIRFDQSIAGENLTPVRETPISLPLEALPSDEAGVVTASIPVTSGEPPPPFGVRLDDQGVYPVSIEVLDAEGSRRARIVTHLIRLPPTTPGMSPLAVALVVPVQAPPAFQPDQSVAFAPGALTSIDAALAALTDWPGVALTVRPTPETIEALASLDADRVPSLAAALAGRQVLGSTYVGIDLGSFVASTDPRADEEVGRQVDAGRETLQRLLDVRPETRTLVTDATMSPSVLTRFRAAGTDRLVVPSQQLGEVDEQAGQPLAQIFDVVADDLPPMRAAASDVTVVERLTQTTDPVLAAHLLLADLAMIHYFAPSASQGIVVAIPDDLEVAASTYQTLLRALDRRSPGAGSSPIVAPVTLDDLFEVTSTESGSGANGAAERSYLSRPSEPATDLVAAVGAARAGIGSFASMVGDGPGGRWVGVLDRQALVAQASTTSVDRRDQYLQGIGRFIDEQMEQVVTPGRQNITLTSRSGRIPVVLENRLEYPLDVELLLTSDKLDFPNGDAHVVELPPLSTTRFEVAVESLATGAFPLDVLVRSPDDGIRLATTRFTVRSTAISGVGLLLSVGAGLFLLLWWARHFRTTRRDRRLVASSHPTMRPPSEPDLSDVSATLPGSARASRAGEGEHVERPHRH
jgi:hypothetical protein